MSLHDPVTLPSGLVLPNRLSKAAMAESLASTHNPDTRILETYKKWAEGGWGMVLTGNVMVSQEFLGSPGDIQVPSETADTNTKTAWEQYAASAQAHNTPAIVQLCHPGRQSPGGIGKAGFFTKRVSASAVKLNFGSGIFARTAATLLFGTPRPLTEEEIRGPGGVVEQFVAGAVQAQRAGFKGVELHAAHGYLLAQFMSPATNTRTDDYGGSAAKRVRIVTDILEATRAATGKGFTIGIKLNSVDASQAESPAEVIEQIGLIVQAGADFIEVSGGTYENPLMSGYKHEGPAGEHARASATTGVKPSTAKREAYFLDFTATLRQHFPDVVLMVTGGFRTRAGMQEAIASGACDVVGIGRPATLNPRLPNEIILNKSISDEEAHVKLDEIKKPWWVDWIPISMVGAGWNTAHYQHQLQKLAA